MLEKPDAQNLLATARAAVLEEILPALPPDKAILARMVAAAIGLALRETTAGQDWQDALQARLRRLVAAPESRLLERLAAEIREGRHDPGTPRHAEVAAWLRDHARLRATISAPRALG
ncbi:DUF6285 domain-containing protein [Falsiroseomonas selenitidurans]|uniref:DUF6285 domain-containing protein n=1 Tax=Falsiroseomonas selenitidurans TaxID=2716335 RepID=A0ABX1DYT8_9PROT|nr:DUF6285 domain-containing protein [Falsiroseomonas selenitidurans]NKC30033.1 hypothetical protein [Falsiroseomonas selenitidurans]